MLKGKACRENLLIFSILALVLMLSACASVPLADRAQDEHVKLFQVPEGKANLYVVETGGYGSSTAIFQVIVDGQAQGSLADWTFFLVPVDPGDHTVMGVSPENSEVAKITAKAGGNYFVRLTARIGWMYSRVSVAEMDGEKGREAVLKAKLAQKAF